VDREDQSVFMPLDVGGRRRRLHCRYETDRQHRRRVYWRAERSLTRLVYTWWSCVETRDHTRRDFVTSGVRPLIFSLLRIVDCFLARYIDDCTVFAPVREFIDLFHHRDAVSASGTKMIFMTSRKNSCHLPLFLFCTHCVPTLAVINVLMNKTYRYLYGENSLLWAYYVDNVGLLWPPYVIGGHYIFAL